LACSLSSRRFLPLTEGEEQERLAVVKIFSKSSSSSGIERRMVELTVQNKRWRLLIPP
jgi:hypothetical protein